MAISPPNNHPSLVFLSPTLPLLSSTFPRATVYFADKSTTSVRYAGAAKPGDSGTLLLCRVSLGRPMLKWLPQPNMRRPPDPFPLFGLEHLRMYAQGRKFHSVFASCDAAFSPLLMNEYIVYHCNQGVRSMLPQTRTRAVCMLCET